MNRRSVAAVVGGSLAGLTGWDLLQRRHTILRNYPIVGHLRFLLEAVGPELRQYIVTDNDAERPFSRDQRRWVYTSSKLTDRYFGFGTDNDLERVHNYPIIKHAAFPVPAPDGEPSHPDPAVPLPAAKVLGGARGRAKAFRPSSLVNVSGMSFGSLSGAAITALNKGAAMAGALQTTGEGGISPYHLNGGDLVWQIGTGYFGCRNDDGTFSLPRLVDKVAATPSIRAIEIKLSQGAKPGLGGMLPGAKVTPEIAAIRGIPVGVDCKSPAGHSAFHDVDGLLELVETIAAETGLPVGIKSAVGEERFWLELATRMARTGTGRRLRHRRRRRGRHRRGSAGLQRPRRPAVQVGLPARLPGLRRPGSAPRRGVHRLGEARHSRERPAGAGHGLRHGQRRPNRHVLHRLHPGAALPHRPLPLRRRHPVGVAAARPRSGAEVGALRELSRHPALRTAVSGPRLRLRPSRPGAAGRDRAARCRPQVPCKSTSCSTTSPDWGLPGPADIEAITSLMSQ